MSRKTVSTILLAVMALALTGCAQLSPEATPAPPTKTPKPTFTHTPDWTPTAEVFPTFTPVPPTATPEPVEPAAEEATPTEAAASEEPTAAPEAVRLTVNQTANIRSGPGTNYAAIGRLSAGDSYPILGKNAAGDWYQFEIEGREGWVTASLVTVTGDAAAIQVAQNIPPPPTARPRPTAAPRPTNPPAQPTAVPPPPAPAYPFQLLKGVERCDPNPGQTYFQGFVRHRNNNPRNGVCVHIAFYGPRTTKCSGCDGVGDGVWGFSPFGGPAAPGTTVEIYVVACPPNIPAGGVTSNFGDLTPQSDKYVYTVQDSVQCTGITFVGD